MIELSMFPKERKVVKNTVLLYRAHKSERATYVTSVSTAGLR